MRADLMYWNKSMLPCVFSRFNWAWMQMKVLVYQWRRKEAVRQSLMGEPLLLDELIRSSTESDYNNVHTS